MTAFTVMRLLAAGMLATALLAPSAALSQQRNLAIQATEKRVALVIGNNEYRHVKKLERAVNDAKAVGAELEKLGFQVLLFTDLDRSRTNQAVGQFVERVAGGGVGLFFFAGHGVQVGGMNYLLPVDINVTRADDLPDEALSLGRLMERIADVRAKFTLMMLDACRDNPFPKAAGRSVGGTRGLAIPAAPEGLMIVYSAGVNEQALDRLGEADQDPNGLFTREFLRYLKQPQVRVDEMVKQVRVSVRQKASSVGHSQSPAIYDQSDGDFYFKREEGQSTAAAAPPVAAPAASAPNDAAIELAFWDSIKTSSNRNDFEEYLRQYPQGRFAGLARNRLNESPAAYPMPPQESRTASPQRAQAAAPAGFKFSNESESEKARAADAAARRSAIDALLSTPCLERIKNRRIRVLIGETNNGVLNTRQSAYGAHFDAISRRLRALGLRASSGEDIQQQFAQADIDAYFKKEREASKDAAASRAAPYILRGLIAISTHHNALVNLKQVGVRMNFALTDTAGNSISEVDTRDESYAGQDAYAMALTLINERADEVVAKLYSDYCRKTGVQ